MPRTPDGPADPGGAALDSGPGKQERVPYSPEERVPKPPAPGHRELVEQERSTQPRGLARLPLIGRLFR
jgi:hypothetical protein